MRSGVLRALLVVAGFLVSWIATDLGHMARPPYIALLALVTGGMTAARAWSGDVSVTDAVTAPVVGHVVLHLAAIVKVSLSRRTITCWQSPA